MRAAGVPRQWCTAVGFKGSGVQGFSLGTGVVTLAWVWTGLLMGLLGTPHCAAMCGALCTSWRQPGAGLPWALHGARLLSYAAGGAVVAAAVSGLAAWSVHSAWLRPLWLALHLAFLGAGLFMLATGQQVFWPANWGASLARAMGLFRVGGLAPSAQADGAPRPIWIQARAAQGVVAAAPRARAWWLGLAWVAWPCGLLQSALMLAALADTALGGALVMAAFGVGSTLGLVSAGWLWQRLQRGTVHATWQARGVRLAGALLALGSGFALAHGLWAQVQQWCAPGLA
jgi:sulfite exporter TauE/SafE